jgi:hypothetical protein
MLMYMLFISAQCACILLLLPPPMLVMLPCALLSLCFTAEAFSASVLEKLPTQQKPKQQHSLNNNSSSSSSSSNHHLSSSSGMRIYLKMKYLQQLVSPVNGT